MSYKFIKDIKDQLRALIFILTVPTLLVHLKMVLPKFGIVKKVDCSILCNLIQIQQSLADREITLFQEVRTRW